MTKIAISLLFLFTTSCFCQSYEEIDERVRNYPQFKTLNDLGIRIQNNFSTDENRIRAAFIWVAHNLRYEKTLDDIFQSPKYIFYNSEYVKNQQLRKLEIEKINHSFQNRRGVCIDYALVLNELFTKFKLNSKVVVGIFKTDIKNKEDIKSKALTKNHSWNAVLLNGQWKLMDVTMASGFFDSVDNRFVRNFNMYYFFTPPSELSKTHFPANINWQLSNKTINIETFYNAPIYFPSYFTNDIKLVKNTKGTLFISPTDELELNFDQLPKRSKLYYQVENSNVLKMVRIKKNKLKGYISKIKLNKQLKDSEFVTLFLENKAILNFKIRRKP
jgi:transglutaminase/protease-like cytokinesis protein 3